MQPLKVENKFSQLKERQQSYDSTSAVVKDSWELENKFSQLKERQQSYDSTLAVVKDSWEQGIVHLPCITG
ncbi:E3 ubiquitin-protein ligase [Sesbania bispinosa]|nr:E3 ubiquitin-protein ligase [Sesbania bispinosa]